MSKYEPHELNIHEEPDSIKEVKILKNDVSSTMSIKEFEISPIVKEGEGSYQVIKAKYGPLAPTDSERAGRSQKDRRFSLNPLLKNPLSVEQEERRVIEEKVKKQVTEIAETAKASGIRDGFEMGQKQGYQDAINRMKAESVERFKRFDQLLIELDQAKDEIFRSNEKILIDLVFKISKKIILKELMLDHAYLARLTRELVTRIGVRDNIRIKINPKDLDSIAELREGLSKAMGELPNLAIETSEEVQLGGCKVETISAEIDGSIEVQLEQLYNSLMAKNNE